jgi:tetratricopeptide (TPR) repeat protein
VVDTGSRDDTPAVARRLGARVFHFPWCGDFSAARNASVDRARGEWIFWMDADDTIDADNGRRLRELAAQPAPPQLLAHVVQVHCPGAGGAKADVTVVDHVKLFRNRADLRFDGRIHEQILPAVRRAGGEVGWTDIFVVHSGADHSAAGRRRKNARDLHLLGRELRDHPGHSFVLFNLGMTLADAGDHAGAAARLADSLCVGVPAESHLRKAYALYAGSLSELGRHGDAYAACRRGIALFPGDPELHFRAGLSAHRIGRPAAAVDHYRGALAAAGERVFASMDRGIVGYKAHFNLAAAYQDLGLPDQAAEAYAQVVQAAPDWPPGWEGRAELAIRSGSFDEAAEQLDAMAARPALQGGVPTLRAYLANRQRESAMAASACASASS